MALLQLDRAEPSGWSVGMVLVTLPDGLLVYSPTWLGDDTLERVRAHGEPRVLVAPNHFHHGSLRRFREAFPDALAVASDRARPRLEKKGHRGLERLEAAESLLGDRTRFVEVPHTKTGECWVEIDEADGPSWVVGDAFFHVPGPLRGAVGWILRATSTGPGLCLGQTYRWLALADERAYRRWLLDRLEAASPRRIHFCHGAPLEGPDAADRLGALGRARLKE